VKIMTRLGDRDAQFAALDALWSQARSGAGHLILVEGALGTGKTALLHAFADRVGKSGKTLRLGATCAPGEWSLPLGVAGQLFLDLDLPADFRARTAELIERITAGVSDTETLAALHNLCRELVELAARVPVLITIDDVQHADPVSALWLLCLARRLATAPILVAAAGDLLPPQEFLATRAELLRFPHSAAMRLAPLSEPAVAALLGECFGAPAAARLAADMFAASGGNPLLLTALLDDWRTGRGIAGRGYQQALPHCVRRCGPVASRVAQGLAVLGDPVPHAVLGTLLDLSTDLVADALGALDSAGLLDSVVATDVGRAALLADLPQAERAALHGGAARLLYERGAANTVVARHIVAGGEVTGIPAGAVPREVTGVPAGAVPRDVTGLPAGAILRDAAESHLLAGETGAAIGCLEHALRHSADPRETAAIRARLTSVEWCVDTIAAARHLPALVADADLLTDAQRVEVCGRLLWHGRDDEARALFGRLDGADPAFDAWLACTHPELAGRAPERGVSVLADVLLHGDHERTADRCERLWQESRVRADPRWSSQSPLVSLLPVVYAGALGTATGWCERWQTDLPADPVPRAQAIAVAAEIALRQGDLVTAADKARMALESISPAAWGTAVCLPLGTLVLAATRMGELDTAAEYLRLPVPTALFDSRYGLHYRYARGVHHLAIDNSHAAAADFLTCGELMRQWSMDVPGLVAWRVELAEVRLRQDERDRARLLLTEQLALLGTDFAEVRGKALRLLAACGPPGQRLRLLSSAVELAEDSGDRFELARSLVDLGHALDTEGEHHRARLTARRAWHVARSCHAEPICQELTPRRRRQDLALSTTDESGLALLSRAERRVATLASGGHSNRAIARKLFITESTVEQHLTKVYRKLNVRSREDLPASLRFEVVAPAVASNH
jgi:DNA-binding CsgD family transcriptional regulator